MQFSLRKIEKSDLESFVRHANNYNIAKQLTDAFPNPYTLEKGEIFLNK